MLLGLSRVNMFRFSYARWGVQSLSKPTNERKRFTKKGVAIEIKMDLRGKV